MTEQSEELAEALWQWHFGRLGELAMDSESKPDLGEALKRLDAAMRSFAVAGWPGKLWVSPGISYTANVWGMSIGAQFRKRDGELVAVGRGGGVMAVEQVRELRDFLNEWLYDYERRGQQPG